MNHYHACSPIHPNAPMRLPTTGFCSCSASLHDIPVNNRLDFPYELVTAPEHQNANRKARKTTRNKGGAL